MNTFQPLAGRVESNAARHSRRGFTRMDLLAALVIVALLGLVLLPVMAGAGERSQRARCQDNLRRIAMGVTIYAGNNSGKMFSARYIAGSSPPTYIQLAMDPPSVVLAGGVGLTLETNGVWTCPNRPGFPTYEAVYPQYNIGYQYFGGVSWWRNPYYFGPSRSPTNLNTAQPHWTLASDAVVKLNGVWGASDRDVAYANTPQHRAENSTVPQGGNQAFVDGSVQWIQAEKMYYLHSWSPTSRECYWYQDTKDFPAQLRSFLPALRFKP